MNTVWTLARMTFRVAIRRRIVLTGLLLGLCFLAVFSAGFHLITGEVKENVEAMRVQGNNPALYHLAMTEGSNTLLLAGLYAATFLSVAMAALLGSETLSGEISSGTIQTIVTKPIRRSDIVFGKWTGFASLLGLYLLLTGGGTLASVWIQTHYLPPHILAGLSLIYLETLLILSIAMLCSSAISSLGTGGVVFGLYGLAFIGGWIEQFGSLLYNESAIKVGIVTSLIIPSESLWRRAAFEMQTPLANAMGMSPFNTLSVPSPLMIGYAVFYLLIVLFFAIRIFNNRDL